MVTARARESRMPRIPQAPVRVGALPRISVPRPKPKRRFPVEVLDRGEVSQLLEACSGHGITDIRNRALIALLYRSGLRINEALSLHPKDIDPARGSVRVLCGKGGKARTAGIDDGALGYVTAWLAARSRLHRAGPLSPLFCSKYGTPVFGGEQGTGKTTAGKLLMRLFDPSPAQVRSQPTNPEQWAIAAAGSWGVLIDNISTIPEWWSDALCKAVTGDGWLRRKLYTDGDIAVLTFRRVIALTSIDSGALRGDLGDRILMVDLEQIPDEKRMSESELERTFHERQPRILGALLSLLAEVLRILPTIKTTRLPRMADFAIVLLALDQSRGTDSYQKFMSQRGRIASEVVEDDPLGAAILAQFPPGSDWKGTAKALLERVTPTPLPKDWPKSPTAFARRLRRVMPVLRQVGVIVTPPAKTDKTREYVIGRNAPNAQTPESRSAPNESDDVNRAFTGSTMPVGPYDRPGEDPFAQPENSAFGRSGIPGVLLTDNSDDDGGNQ